MSETRSLSRILVVGRETGPIVRLLKRERPNIEIGAVDILGNREIRKIADWKFSVERQSPKTSIFREKHRDLIDLLYELTLVMLEDIKFDLLILLSPFHTKPNLIHNLSREIEVAVPNIDSLESTSTNYRLLTKLDSEYEFQQSDSLVQNLSKNANKLLFLYITKLETKSFSFSEFQKLNKSTDQVGFVIPYSQIHCAFFISSPQWLNFLGLQTVVSPYQHQFFFSHFERNALIPFSVPADVSIEILRDTLSKIVRELNLVGFITLYFCFLKDKIIPISCTALPDENFDLWQNRVKNPIIPYLLSKEIDMNPHISSKRFAFKLPIYSKQPIYVPYIPDYATQRNLAGIISSPNYPLCVISGSNSNLSVLQSQLKHKKAEILKSLSLST